MERRFVFCKRNIKHIILLVIFLSIAFLPISKTNASTIDESHISINVDADGVCYIEEKLYVTAIDEPAAYTWNYARYPSMQLTRGDIDNICINNLKLSDYYDKWWPDRAIYGQKSVSIINLFYPQSRKISIFIILHKES